MTAPTATNNTAPMTEEDCQRIYWHRELPPLDANIMGEHVLEATSGRVQGTLAHRDELWDRCYRDLLANTRERFTQEINRLGGRYAHVLDEHVDSRHDDVAGEAWLRGRFTYVLYR
jgi:phage terminase large subunit-like protein